MRYFIVVFLFALSFVSVNSGNDTKEELSFMQEVEFKEDPWLDVTITTYNPTKAQCDDTPLITSCRAHIDTFALRREELKWCAVSRNLLETYHYGDTIEVFIKDGHMYNGRYKVMDTMNKRFTNYIDILTLSKGGKWQGRIK